MDMLELAKNFLPCRECSLANTAEAVNLPGAAQVAVTLRHLFSLLYPGCHGVHAVPHERCRMHIERLFAQIAGELEDQIRQMLLYRREEEVRDGKETVADPDCAQEAKKEAES